MKEPNRERKGDIKSINAVQLNDEQKEAMSLIHQHQIVVITGRAGSGKSLVCAAAGLKFLKTKQIDTLYSTRAAIEVGKSLGFLPGSLGEKFDPYIEAFKENLKKCSTDKADVDDLFKTEKIQSLPVQFIRGKTMDDVLIVEEAQNLTKSEMLAILTRLGKTGKIIVNGDLEQQDTNEAISGLAFAIELSKVIEGIVHIKLKENHRSDLVGKILDHVYRK